MNHQLYIILPVHNRKDLTKAFIETLKKQTLQDFHLVLIDDGSTDGTIEVVEETITDFTLIKGNGNLWWGGALHESYKWVKNNNIDPDAVILMINDDTIIDNDYLEKGMNIFKNRSRSILLSENFDKNTGELIDIGFYINWKTLSISKQKKKDLVNCFSTRGLFLKAADYMEIGGFYPTLLPHYLSDLEFTYRAYKKGFDLHTDSSLKIFSSDETSGFRGFDHYRSFSKFLNHYMSKKNTTNPLHWMTFITLSAPVLYIPHNLLRICTSAVVTISKTFYRINIKHA